MNALLKFEILANVKLQMYNCKLQFVVSPKKNLMLKVSNKFNEPVRGKGQGLTEMVRKPLSSCRFFM